MDSATLLTIAASLVVALFSVLSAVIGWVGARLATKQDEMIAKLDLIKDELHVHIANVGIRLVKVEERVRVGR